MKSAGKIEFFCDKCEFIAYGQKIFEKHYQNHKNDVVHLCRKCGHVLASLKELVHHIKNDCANFKDILLNCGVRPCEYSSADPFDFISHMKYAHRGSSLLPCFHCNKCFTYPILLIQHMQIGCAEKIELPQKKRESAVKRKTVRRKRKMKIVYSALPSRNCRNKRSGDQEASRSTCVTRRPEPSSLGNATRNMPPRKCKSQPENKSVGTGKSEFAPFKSSSKRQHTDEPTSTSNKRQKLTEGGFGKDMLSTKALAGESSSKRYRQNAQTSTGTSRKERNPTAPMQVACRRSARNKITS